MNTPRAERRKHPRTESALPLKIFKKGLDVITESRNISCSGVYCRVSKPLPMMSKIGLTLLLPACRKNKLNTEKVKCNGVVVRSEPEIVEEADSACQNVAIFFTDLSNKDRNKIAEYVLRSFKK